MVDELSYSAAKERLDEMVVEIRRKDISLEKSLDLLEEAVALVNRCNEMIDQADWEEIPEDADELDATLDASEESTKAEAED